MRSFSVRVATVAISNPSNSLRAFPKGFVEYKCVAQVLKDYVPLAYFVVVDMYAKHRVKENIVE